MKGKTRNLTLSLAVLTALGAMLAEPVAAGKRYSFEQAGKASWYGPGFEGRRTASGDRYDPSDMTAAHRDLPFGSKVRVTNIENGRSVVVEINDRGPYKAGRVIDLSKGAAKRLGMVEDGVAPVTIVATEQMLASD